MAEEAKLEVVIEAQVDRVLAGLLSVERSLKALEAGHIAAAQRAEEHGLKLEAFIGKLAGVGAGLAGGVAALGAAVGLIERVMAAFSSLEKFNLDLLRTTEIMGGNAQAASTWNVIAHQMGVDIEQVDRGFAKLSHEINSGGAALKQMGIATEDDRGNLRALNDVLGDTADYFRAHAGAANEAGLANELFGRSGFMLLPALEQGREGIQKITDEAKKYGLILDSEAIQKHAAFTFQLKEAEMAVQGLEVAIGNVLLPHLAMMGQMLSQLIEAYMPGIISALDRVSSYIIGFAEGLTGMTARVNEGAMALGSLSHAATGTGTGMDRASGAAHSLADAQARIRDQAKDATQALDDQIRALNAQTAAAHFADQQARLQEQIAHKDKDVLRLREEYYRQYWMGNFLTAQNLLAQIDKAEEDGADLRKQVVRNTEDEATKQKIAALETQKRSIENAAQEQISVMQRAARATTDALTGAASEWPPLFSRKGEEAAGRMKYAMVAGAEETGQEMARKLMDALFGEQKLIWDSKGEHVLGVEGRSGGPQWDKLGQAIGASIGRGIGIGIGAAASDEVHKWGHQLQAAANFVGAAGLPFEGLLMNSLSDFLLSFHTGGRVPGIPGQEVPIMAQAGEQVFTANQSEAIVTAMHQSNAFLAAILAAIGSSRGASGAGVQAALYNAIQSTADLRNRGIVGASA